jgi:hypothetical protein
MSRLLILALVALFSLSPMMRMSAGAQEAQHPGDATDADEWPWEGVGPIEEVSAKDTDAWSRLTEFLGAQHLDTRSLTASLMGFRVPFQNLPDERSAYIPEIIGAEFMVVIVSSGEFILDAKGPGSYLVDPAPVDGEYGNIAIMNGEISDDGKRIYYEETGLFIVDENGHTCGRLCTVLPGFAVRLEPGDRVIAPAGAICVWCLFQSKAEGAATPQAEAPEDLAKGELIVFPLVRKDHTFSWIRAILGSGAGIAAATPTAGRVASGGVRAAPEMAVLLNPGPGCHRGSG